jgi:hypothetical protein
MKVQRHNYDWRTPLAKTGIKPTELFHHHSAGNEKSVMDIHNYHRNVLCEKGMPYNYVVLNGEVHEGRPEGYWGAHTLNHNDQIAICVVGKYHLHPMGLKNRKAARELTRDIHRRHPGIRDRKHRDVNPTACPGRFYPFGYITRPAVPTKVAVRDYPRFKVLMRDWARAWNTAHPDDTIDFPKGFGWKLPNFGSPAQTLLWRITVRMVKLGLLKEPENDPTPEIAALLGMKKYRD